MACNLTSFDTFAPSSLGALVSSTVQQSTAQPAHTHSDRECAALSICVVGALLLGAIAEDEESGLGALSAARRAEVLQEELKAQKERQNEERERQQEERDNAFRQ